MDIQVELCAFTKGEIRTVGVPDDEAKACKTTGELLERVFYWGQNDVQSKPLPSVSVGDVVRLDGKRYQVADVGFRILKEGESPASPFSFFTKGDVK